ncbi:MAG: GLPGLI family protein [Bacteroidales bacterium]
MKSILPLMFLCLVLVPARGQDEKKATLYSGKITYIECTKLDIKLEGDAAQFAANLPKEQKTEKVLLFSNDATMFQEGSNVEEEMEMTQGEGVHIRMVPGGNNKLYTDLKNKTTLDQRDFMNRMFIVERPIIPQEWKVTGNQKNILGYNCLEAVKQDTSGKKTIAWFAPAIPVQGGPSVLNSLPGMILEADLDNGARTYITKSIEDISLKDLKLEKPKEGKKVSEDEFKSIIAEKMKEMGIEGDAGNGGGNQVRVWMIKRQ